MESVTLSLPEAYDLALAVLSANGFSADHAAAIARNVAAGERDGCASHGLWRLLGIVDTLRKGKVSPDAEPQIHDQAPAIVRADAGGAFSLLAYERALPLLLEKARHSGIAALAINRCVHFSALFADIEPLTEAGLVGLACTPSHAWVAPAGGTVRCSAPTLSPLAGRGGISRRLLLIWRPAPRRAARSSCISAPAKRYRKGGESTVRDSRRPMPQRC
jgi:LDH2 family malate/lactate/ureidoglycolate dehydrogenase